MQTEFLAVCLQNVIFVTLKILMPASHSIPEAQRPANLVTLRLDLGPPNHDGDATTYHRVDDRFDVYQPLRLARKQGRRQF